MDNHGDTGGGEKFSLSSNNQPPPSETGNAQAKSSEKPFLNTSDVLMDISDEETEEPDPLSSPSPPSPEAESKESNHLKNIRFTFNMGKPTENKRTSDPSLVSSRKKHHPSGVEEKISQARLLLIQALSQSTNQDTKTSLENAIKAVQYAQQMKSTAKFLEPVFLKNPSEFSAKNHMETRLNNLEQKIDLLINKQSEPQVYTMKPAEKSTWAQKVAQNIPSNIQSKMPEKASSNLPPPPPQTQQNSIPSSAPTNNPSAKQMKPARLIVLINDPVTIDPITIRDNINKALRNASVSPSIAIAGVELSKNNNLILTCIKGCTAKEMMEVQNIWRNTLCNHQDIKMDEKWIKILAHQVPTFLNNLPITMEQLQQDIQMFNPGIKLQTCPRWLVTNPYEKGKQHSSVVLSLPSQEAAKSILKSGLFIFGTSVRVAKYIDSRPDTQCRNCLRFGHVQQSCRKEPRCNICAKPHSTNNHICNQCTSIGSICEHTVLKCGNCDGPHMANSRTCPSYLALKATSSTTSQQ
jgi:hypothetical protein